MKIESFSCTQFNHLARRMDWDPSNICDWLSCSLENLQPETTNKRDGSPQGYVVSSTFSRWIQSNVSLERNLSQEELGSRIEIRYVLKSNRSFNVLSGYDCIVKLLISISLAFFFAVKAEKELNWEDPSFINALEIENKTLQERIAACKSNIMMVTSFDKRTTQVWNSGRHQAATQCR